MGQGLHNKNLYTLGSPSPWGPPHQGNHILGDRLAPSFHSQKSISDHITKQVQKCISCFKCAVVLKQVFSKYFKPKLIQVKRYLYKFYCWIFFLISLNWLKLIWFQCKNLPKTDEGFSFSLFKKIFKIY